MVNEELMNKIVIRSRFRFDCCSFVGGVAYRVEGKKPTHIAYDGSIFELTESKDEVKIGEYVGGVYGARRALRELNL